MIMVQNQKGLTIEQLEERFEMVVASKGSSDETSLGHIGDVIYNGATL